MHWIYKNQSGDTMVPVPWLTSSLLVGLEHWQDGDPPTLVCGWVWRKKKSLSDFEIWQGLSYSQPDSIDLF